MSMLILHYLHLRLESRLHIDALVVLITLAQLVQFRCNSLELMTAVSIASLEIYFPRWEGTSYCIIHIYYIVLHIYYIVQKIKINYVCINNKFIYKYSLSRIVFKHENNESEWWIKIKVNYYYVFETNEICN